MALQPFLSIGIIYDTCVQVAQVSQVVERATIQGDSERCVVVAIESDDMGYLYTLVGLDSYQLYSTRYVFDSKDSYLGVSADLGLPVFMNPEQVAHIHARAQLTAEIRNQEAAAAKQTLSLGAHVVQYSEKCLAIFTSEPADTAVLERIRAKRNPSLSYQGRKVAGWIFPKCRQEQLAAVVKLA